MTLPDKEWTFNAYWQGASSGAFLKDIHGRQIRLPRYSCWNEQGEIDPDVRRSLPPDYPPRPPLFSAPHHIWILCSALTSRPKNTYWLHGNEPNCRLLEFDGDRILRCFLLGRALERFPGAESAEIWATVTPLVAGRHLSVMAKLLELDIHGRYLNVVGTQDVEIEGLPPHDMLEDVFEALISAVYRCFGYQVLSRWLALLFDPWLDRSNDYFHSCVHDIPKDSSAPLIKPPYDRFVDHFFRPRHCDDTRPTRAYIRHGRLPLDRVLEFPPDYPPLPPLFASSSDERLLALKTSGLNRRFASLGYALQHAVAGELAFTTTGTDHSKFQGANRINAFTYYLTSVDVTSFLSEAYEIQNYAASADGLKSECLRALFGFVYHCFGLEKTVEWMKALYMPWVELAYTTRTIVSPVYRNETSFVGERSFPFVRPMSRGELLVYSSALQAFTTLDIAGLDVSQKGRDRAREWLMTRRAFVSAKRHWHSRLPDGDSAPFERRGWYLRGSTSSPPGKSSFTLMSQKIQPQSPVPGFAEPVGPKPRKFPDTPRPTTSTTSTSSPPPPSDLKASPPPLHDLVLRSKERASRPCTAVLRDLVKKAKRFKPR